MSLSERRDKMLFSIELMEEVVLGILEDARDFPHGLDVRTIALKAGVPAPSEAQLVRYVLKQLEKTGRAEQSGSGPNGVEWRMV